MRRDGNLILRLARIRAGLNQTEAAGRIGQNQAWLSKVERGLIEMRAEERQKLAEVLDIPNRLMTGEERQNGS